MTLLQMIVNILIKIGNPLVKFLKKIIKNFREIKTKIIKFKWPRFKWPKIKLPKWKIKKKTNRWLSLPKIRVLKIKFSFKKISIKNKIWFFLGVILFLIIILAGFYWWIIRDLPNINLIYNPPNLSTKILDRNGKVLYKFYQNENRTWVPLNKIPKDLIEATIAIEDKNFYSHHGLDIKGLINAIIYNFKKSGDDKLRGGSTITQQLVKNVFLDNKKTIKRKIRELVLTLILEQKMTKNEILERYLNQVSYGGEAYGVEEATQKYFGKDVSDLNTVEAAYLAGLPAAPSSYSPYGNTPELGEIRAKHVIEEMVNNGYLNKDQANKWLNEKINIKTDKTQIEAPHFVFYIKNILEEKYGYTNIEKQGLIIKTSLDLDTQQTAQKIVTDEVKKINNLKISNGAALIIDVKSGDILAMIGSVDYNSKNIDGKFNVTTGLRQPGSSIKPINYLLALENGYSFASTIIDSPVSYQLKGQKDYTPKNYNGKYMGTVTLRTALASSLNIPSVKLLEKNGVNNMINLAENMGITTWTDRSRFGLSLALGSGEVKMTELAQAYSIFANLGEKVEINPILEIDNYLGEKIYQKETEKTEVIKPEYAFMINDVLSDNQARSPIFGANSKLMIKDKTVAVKTGTTNNLKDNWCIGWTPSFLVATWVGNNDGTSMSWVASGVTGATPIWNDLMQEILKNKGDEQWTSPTDLIKKNICGKDEWTIDGSEIKINCPIIIATPTLTN